LADQLATAIENRRLVEKLENAVQETTTLYQTRVREGWAAITPGLKATAYEYDQRKIQPISPELPAEWLQQLRDGKSVVLPGKDGEHRSTLLVPVTLRDQIIGVIGLEEDDPNFQWSADEIAIAEAAASQAALTLENARLLEETQQQAIREQMIGQIAARVRETLDIDTVLKTTLHELGSSLDVSEVEVRIGQPQLLNEA
jgi:GAF domain-containing protein